MLQQLESEGSTDIVCWQPHGRAFRVNNITAFETIVLPRFFRHSKMSSFRRQLNIYNFNRILIGQDEDAYYHEFFIRNQPELLLNIERIPTKTIGIGRGASVLDPITFYEEAAQDSSTALSATRVDSMSNTASTSVDNASQQQSSIQRRIHLEQQLLQIQNEIDAHTSRMFHNSSAGSGLESNNSTTSIVNNIAPLDPYTLFTGRQVPYDRIGQLRHTLSSYDNNFMLASQNQSAINMQQQVSINSLFANQDASQVINQQLFRNHLNSSDILNLYDNAHSQQHSISSLPSVRNAGTVEQHLLFNSPLQLIMPNNLQTNDDCPTTDFVSSNIRNNSLQHSLLNSIRRNTLVGDGGIDAINLPTLQDGTPSIDGYLVPPFVLSTATNTVGSTYTEIQNNNVDVRNSGTNISNNNNNNEQKSDSPQTRSTSTSLAEWLNFNRPV